VTIKIANPNISKNHCEIVASETSLFYQDLGSSNGTYVNGVRAPKSRLQMGDKISFFDVIAEVIPAPKIRAPMVRPNSLANSETLQGPKAPIPFSQMPPAPYSSNHPSPSGDSVSFPNSTPKITAEQAFEKLIQYIDRAFLGPLYKLAEVQPLRNIIAGITIGYILIVVLFATLPTSTLLTEQSHKEGMRRALTIARFIKTSQEKLIFNGNDHLVDLSFAINQDNVERAWILSAKDGSIMHPADRLGMSPDNPWAYNVRKRTTESTGDLGGGKLGAAVPLIGLNPETASMEIRAWAVVIYSTGVIPWERLFGLAIQNLVIAAILGFILYILLQRLIEKPISTLSAQIEDSFRSGEDEINLKFNFDLLQNLSSQFSSMITRLKEAQNKSQTSQREAEYHKLPLFSGYPSLVLGSGHQLWSCNELFTHVTGLSAKASYGQPLSAVSQEAWSQNILSLVENAKLAPTNPSLGESQFTSGVYQIAVMALCNDEGQAEAYWIVIMPPGTALGVAA
jgi:hypothetical protein